MNVTDPISPLIYCVVLNWNNPEETAECVESLLKAEYRNLKIILVDNASTDKSVEILTKRFHKIPLLKNSHNAGYAGGNNLGIQWAIDHGARYVLVLNNDVIVDRQLINELLIPIQRDESIGVVTGKVYYKNDPNRIYSGAGKIIRWKCTGANRGSLLRRHYQHNTEHTVDYICGVLFLARADVFKTLGLLDEKYFMYFEDLEFSRRVSSGFLIYYTPKAVAYHKSGGGTRWLNYPAMYHYYQTRNRFLVFEKDPIYYRAYVMIFALFVTLSKSVVILLTVAKNKSSMWNRLTALWTGLRDGVKIFFRSNV